MLMLMFMLMLMLMLVFMFMGVLMFVFMLMLMFMLMFMFMFMRVMMVAAFRIIRIVVLRSQLGERALQCIRALHRFQKLVAGELLPRRCDNHGVRIAFPQQRQRSVQLFRGKAAGTA